MRSFTIVDCVQRSPEWFRARAGRLTGSNAAHAIAFTKLPKRKDGIQRYGRETVERAKLRRTLVAERLTGRALDDDAFVTADLRRGVAMEGTAAAAYEAATGLLLRSSGFLSHNTLMVGCSLDGYVGEHVTGIVELKNPKSTTHLEYLLGGRIPDDYVPQTTHNLWVSGAEWCDFVSHDDRFLNEAFHLFRVRVHRDDVDIAGYASKAEAFLAEVERDIATLASMHDLSGVLASMVSA